MTERNPESRVLSFIIPVYNEVAHLQEWCDGFFAFDFGVPIEVVFVDDASTDDSLAILDAHSGSPNVRIARHETNQGKGAALKTGIQQATGDFLIIQDADFEYRLADVRHVVAPLYADEADVVFGSRFKNPKNVHRTAHYAVNRALTLFSNLMSGLYVTDMETCYKAFRREIIQGIDIQSPRFGFEPEITAKIATLKLRVQEVPVRYFPRNYLEGKKIRWTDGVAALWQIVRYNLDKKHLKESTRNVPEKYRSSGVQWL